MLVLSALIPQRAAPTACKRQGHAGHLYACMILTVGKHLRVVERLWDSGGLITDTRVAYP